MCFLQKLFQIRGPTGFLRRETFSPDAKLEEVMLFIRSQYHLTSDIYDLLQVWNTKINFSWYYSTEVI